MRGYNKIFWWFFVLFFFNIIVTFISSFFGSLRYIIILIQTIILPLYFFFLIRLILVPQRFPSNFIPVVSPADGLVLFTGIIEDGSTIVEILTPWTLFLYAKFSPVFGKIQNIEIEDNKIIISLCQIINIDNLIEGSKDNVIQEEIKQVNNVKIIFEKYYGYELYIFLGQTIRKGDLIGIIYFQSITILQFKSNNLNFVVNKGQKLVGGESPILT